MIGNEAKHALHASPIDLGATAEHNVKAEGPTTTKLCSTLSLNGFRLPFIWVDEPVVDATSLRRGTPRPLHR
jgi:hypothetical protein